VQNKLNLDAQVMKKQRVTVMLSVASDGHKLPPYGILNRKTIRKNEMLSKDIMFA
jgi:hypothetical protein